MDLVSKWLGAEPMPVYHDIVANKRGLRVHLGGQQRHQGIAAVLGREQLQYLDGVVSVLTR